MYIGYVFDICEANAVLTVHLDPSLKEEDVMFQDSSDLEKLAKNLNAEFICLNWEYCAFAIEKNMKPSLYLNKNFKLKDYDLLLKPLKEGLLARGFDLPEASLLEEPQWTRHGEPITYENWVPGDNDD